ncbi:hypothetical protein Moror_15589 [Moniliophthora roreri MCA 2997]|uniref:Uncharacterized protein n=1 Tax=Moniliophthora roreri (strain MCA 2997) TaxID=1381753 RepID=V2WT99_MONRO|nr:hypothetical protein Moror_15589 [Moniliophthora roreri MCA 2997]
MTILKILFVLVLGCRCLAFRGSGGGGGGNGHPGRGGEGARGNERTTITETSLSQTTQIISVTTTAISLSTNDGGTANSPTESPTATRQSSSMASETEESTGPTSLATTFMSSVLSADTSATMSTQPPPPPSEISQSNNQFKGLTILGTVLGALFGIFVILASALYFVRHRHRKPNRNLSGIGFNDERTVPRRWWNSPRYNFRKGNESHIETEAANRSLSDSLAPSDSVSQLWNRGKSQVRDKPLPDLTVVSEDLEG